MKKTKEQKQKQEINEAAKKEEPVIIKTEIELKLERYEMYKAVNSKIEQCNGVIDTMLTDIQEIRSPDGVFHMYHSLQFRHHLGDHLINAVGETLLN